MDGYGLREESTGNCIQAANTPNLDALMAQCPMTQLGASGMNVGLPDGQMGNSEVGHTNIGAGRIVYQQLTLITKQIRDGSFAANEALRSAMLSAAEEGRALHLYGLLSDGGVHSHNTHLYAAVEMARDLGVKNIFVHAFMDGRDVAPTSGAGFLEELEAQLNTIGAGKIASVMGRFYAMDRDNRWERVQKAYDCMTGAEGFDVHPAAEGTRLSYSQDVTDEFIVPFRTPDFRPIRSGDSIICFNFRPDRAREITRCFADEAFAGFERPYMPVHYVCFTQYDAAMPNVSVAFGPQELNNIFGEYLAAKGMTQLRIAETEKYAHVTFFFNGGREEPFPGEDRILVPSPKVATYDLQPEMSAFEVCDKVCAAIRGGTYDAIILNYANCDMVGHTAVPEAVITAVEAVDACVGRTVEAVRELGGIALVTADHGNADEVRDAEGNPFTQHTTNPVPLILAAGGEDRTLADGGCLADIIPTMMDLMGLEQPCEMSGRSLLQ